MQLNRVFLSLCVCICTSPLSVYSFVLNDLRIVGQITKSHSYMYDFKCQIKLRLICHLLKMYIVSRF